VIRLRNDSLDFELDRTNDSLPLRINAIESDVPLHDSEAVIIGGVISSKRNSLRTRNPYISRIPLIGKFFRAEIHDEERRELVVVLKPSILRDDSDYPELSSAQEEFIQEIRQPLIRPEIEERPHYDID
jgi:type II secretory pathway component GspD/PulD (secretin)